MIFSSVNLKKLPKKWYVTGRAYKDWNVFKAFLDAYSDLF